MVGRVLGQVAVMSTLGGQVAVRRIWDGQNCTVSLPRGAGCSPWGAGFAQGSAWGHWDAARPQHQGSSSSMCLQDAASGRHFFAHECSWRIPAREHTCVCVLQEGQSQQGECWGEWRENGGTGSGCRRRHWDVPASSQKLSPCFEAVREAGSAPALTAGS